ncbi:MAG: MltA domain-containing protein [Campylobacteraceae bacterium]|nr:MltA domain-containing protein [Campylobacteraceae bacterium]
MAPIKKARGFICSALAAYCLLSAPLFAEENFLDKTQNSSAYIEKINPDEIDLSKIFSVDLRRDENFLKAIDSSIQFYTSILGTDEQFTYGNEQYTPLQMLQSLIMFRKMVAKDRPYDEFLVELKEYFDVYSTRASSNGSKFTGYYTPEIQASQVKTKTFKYPLYLTKARLKSSKPDFYVQTRNDIRTMEMEGAAILALNDGQMLNLQYAGRKRAIDELASQKAKIVKKIVKKDGKKKAVLVKVRQAPKTKAVFYITDTKPLGSLSTELVPGYSAAMDMNVTPVGSLIYVKSKETSDYSGFVDGNAKEEKKSGFESFMLVHDIGGAIKGAGRVDIYCGEGRSAQSCTYNVSSKGFVYLLVAKKEALKDFSSQEVK